MIKEINIGNLDPSILFGAGDKNIEYIQDFFNCKITLRNSIVTISSDNENNKLISSIFEEMIKVSERKKVLTLIDIKSIIELFESNEDVSSLSIEQTILNTKKGKIITKTIDQKNFYDLVQKEDLVFALGPAGTGKTYLSVAFAVAAYKSKSVKKIVLTRPAVESGERLGFLPGDLKEKIDPYLAPLYDALEDMVGIENLKKMLSNKIVEIVPLAYMRGRTLNDAFIILDEAQNCSKIQMKMFLTRIGKNSKAIINGDSSQMDLYNKNDSGLTEAENKLNSVPGIGFVNLKNSDVGRHSLVKKILDAYSN